MHLVRIDRGIETLREQSVNIFVITFSMIGSPKRAPRFCLSTLPRIAMRPMMPQLICI